jgi:hypothetical protein
MWSLMTSEVILYFLKNLHLHNVSIQNQFINKYAREKKALVKYRRTYVFKKIVAVINCWKFDISKQFDFFLLEIDMRNHNLLPSQRGKENSWH